MPHSACSAELTELLVGSRPTGYRGAMNQRRPVA